MRWGNVRYTNGICARRKLGTTPGTTGNTVILLDGPERQHPAGIGDERHGQQQPRQAAEHGSVPEPRRETHNWIPAALRFEARRNAPPRPG